MTTWEVQNSRVYFETSEIEVRAEGRAPRVIYTALMYERGPAAGHVLLAQGWGVSDEAAAMADAMKNHAAKLDGGIQA